MFIAYCNDQMLQYLNCHDIAEILLKVALNTIKQTIYYLTIYISASRLYPTEARVFSHSSSSVRVTWRGILIEFDEATIDGYRVGLFPFRN